MKICLRSSYIYIYIYGCVFFWGTRLRVLMFLNQKPIDLFSSSIGSEWKLSCSVAPILLPTFFLVAGLFASFVFVKKEHLLSHFEQSPRRKNKKTKETPARAKLQAESPWPFQKLGGPSPQLRGHPPFSPRRLRVSQDTLPCTFGQRRPSLPPKNGFLDNMG